MILRPSRPALLFLAALDPEITPLRLTEGEKRALVAFLSSLTGTVQDGLR